MKRYSHLSFLDEKKEIHSMSGKVVEALSFPCVDNGGKGAHTTVLSNVVFKE
ncbi:MAG: hypothetical protein WAW37_00710 [Syntrophobacteraceae bacterium]